MAEVEYTVSIEQSVYYRRQVEIRKTAGSETADRAFAVAAEAMNEITDDEDELPDVETDDWWWLSGNVSTEHGGGVVGETDTTWLVDVVICGNFTAPVCIMANSEDDARAKISEKPDLYARKWPAEAGPWKFHRAGSVSVPTD